MTRVQLLLVVAAGLLLAVLFFVLLWQPRSEEIAAVEDEIARVQEEEQATRDEIARLREVRAEAPEFEAALNAAKTILPPTPASPALLRQLQTAADDANLELQTVAVGRPSESAVDPALAEMTLNVAIAGTYFQLIDFLRRVEDPALVSRGVLWGNMSLSPGEYPELNVTLTGRVFSDAEGSFPPDAVEEPAPETETDAELEDDVEADDVSDAEDAAPGPDEAEEGQR